MRQYHYFLLLAQQPKPWFKDCWLQIEAIIEQILQQSPHYKQTRLQSFQYENQQAIKFGSMSWTGKSRHKWLWQQDQPGRFFTQLNISTPALSLALKQGDTPDIYIQIELPYRSSTDINFSFEYTIFISIEDCPEVAYDIRPVKQLASQLQALKLLYCQRPWWRMARDPAQPWYFSNEITYCSAESIFWGENGQTSFAHLPLEQVPFQPFWQDLKID